jgi:hypothetical protein
VRAGQLSEAHSAELLDGHGIRRSSLLQSSQRPCLHLLRAQMGKYLSL